MVDERLNFELPRFEDPLSDMSAHLGESAILKVTVTGAKYLQANQMFLICVQYSEYVGMQIHCKRCCST